MKRILTSVAEKRKGAALTERRSLSEGHAVTFPLRTLPREIV